MKGIAITIPTPYGTVKVSSIFLDEHDARDCLTPYIIKSGKVLCEIPVGTMEDEAWTDLYTDAWYYMDLDPATDCDWYPGLPAIAGRVFNKMKKAMEAAGLESNPYPPDPAVEEPAAPKFRKVACIDGVWREVEVEVEVEVEEPVFLSGDEVVTDGGALLTIRGKAHRAHGDGFWFAFSTDHRYSGMDEMVHGSRLTLIDSQYPPDSHYRF
tara:strand:+ start:33 stop:665 length:633 start_codon:yes stop_codon:yes gene_type:complete